MLMHGYELPGIRSLKSITQYRLGHLNRMYDCRILWQRNQEDEEVSDFQEVAGVISVLNTGINHYWFIPRVGDDG